jgi:hypothetical protein
MVRMNTKTMHVLVEYQNSPFILSELALNSLPVEEELLIELQVTGIINYLRYPKHMRVCWMEKT